MKKRIIVQTSSGKKGAHISKITRANKFGGMAQGVEHLPIEHMSPSTNPGKPNNNNK
jgi:hypothetical protein